LNPLRFMSSRCLTVTHFLYLFGGKPAIRYRVGGDRLPEFRSEVIETPVPFSPQPGGDMLGYESPVAVGAPQPLLPGFQCRELS
ncbi:MAG: hypothetical protein OXH64_06215, partial [Rhodospirillaceae bacterium]|nr:hypothetical protein [Rhodospirillaceae bacterium]